jgi:adenine/guanine phosphoribosyltransferase-like PRPP-binding protein
MERLGAKVAGYAFLVELKALGGRAKLGDAEIVAFVEY